MAKIYVDGADGIGWSIDKDRQLLISSIKRLGLNQTENYFEADIIHNIWWNSLLSYKKYFLRFKKNILVTTSNYVDLDDDAYELANMFRKTNNIASAWIVPSMKQKAMFDSYRLKSYYFPFTIDLDLFSPVNKRVVKKELLEKYQIPEEVVKNKIIIGSFQRDSLGSDLSKPKWQKNPGLLIELLKDLPASKFILLLAGPRRHYVISECKKNNIPYYFIGEESVEDDVQTNSLAIGKMPDLYALLDIYLVVSSSEGGPKAVLEANATKTLVMSTDVGLARDFIDERFVFSDVHQYKKTLYSVVGNYKSGNYLDVIEKQYIRVNDVIGESAMDERLIKIYQDYLQ